MKTPEQMAEEYINDVLESQCDCSYRIAFLAGYQAAKDQLADADKVMPQWISVKERLPEIGKHEYSEDVLLLSQVGRMEVSNIQKVKRVVKWRGIEPVIETENGTPIEDFTHWMPLPEPPKDAKE